MFGPVLLEPENYAGGLPVGADQLTRAAIWVVQTLITCARLAGSGRRLGLRALPCRCACWWQHACCMLAGLLLRTCVYPPTHPSAHQHHPLNTGSDFQSLCSENLAPEGNPGREQDLQDKMRALILKGGKLGGGGARQPALRTSGGSGGAAGVRLPNRMVTAVSTLPGGNKTWLTNSRPAGAAGPTRRQLDENEQPQPGGGRYSRHGPPSPQLVAAPLQQGGLWRPQEVARPTSAGSGQPTSSGAGLLDPRASLSGLPSASMGGRSHASRGAAAAGLAASAQLALRQFELKAAQRPPVVEQPHKSPWRPPGAWRGGGWGQAACRETPCMG